MVFWILLAILAVAIYFFNQHVHSYWLKLGIPFKEPTFLIGETATLLSMKESFGDYFANLYNTYKHKRLLGIYFIHRPNLVITDPLLIQDVMIKEFSSFHDRGFAMDENVDPLANHLFGLDGQKWRDLRVKLSPTFTTGKLKGMYPVIRDCAQTLQDFIGKEIKNGSEELDIRDLLARFTTSVISTVAFGIENDCINDPENTFRKMGLKINQPTFKQAFQNIIVSFLPELANFLKFKQVPQDVEDFIMALVRDTIEYREKNKNYARKDFMQLLIQLKNQGYVSVDKDEEFDDNEDKSHKNLEIKKLTFNEVAAQTFLFFVAGFETSSSTSNFCMLELCRHPEIQKKVQDEIDRVIKEANSKEITYDMLGKMKYLECCIDEALRKYPIVPILNRECSKEHKFAGTNWTLKKGTPIVIPVQGLHRDPDIYENPMEFQPERFLDSPTGNGKSKGVFYLPFGDGPRNCIGFRMGKLQTKLGLAMILSKFSFELVDKSLMHKELEIDPKQFIISPKEAIKLKATAR